MTTLAALDLFAQWFGLASGGTGLLCAWMEIRRLRRALEE